MTADKWQTSVCPSVCLSFHGSVLLSKCVHSICRVRFRFRDRISNEFRRNFKNCKLKEKVRKRRGEGGEGKGGLRKSANFIITWLVKTFAAQWVCCQLFAGQNSLAKFKFSWQRVSKSISKIRWTMPFVVCVCVCRCLSTFIFGKCRYKLRQ